MQMMTSPLVGEIIPPGQMVTVFVRLSPLRDERHRFEIPAGLLLSEILDDCLVRLDYLGLLANWHVSVGGVPIGRAYWDCVRVKPGAVVAFTRVPSGDVFRKIASIAVAILATVVAPFLAAPIISALGLGTVAAGIVTGVIAAGLTVAGTLAINALFPKSSTNALADNSTPVFSIGGAQNQAAPFGAIPVILGTHRVSPLYAAQPYTEIVGNDQYLRLLFVVGYGIVSVTDLKIGETALSDFEGLTFEVLQNHLVNAPTLFTEPTYEEQLSINLTPVGTWSSRTTADEIDEFSVDIGFPSGVYRYQASDTSKQNYTVNVAIQYRKVGTLPWISTAGISVTANSVQAIRQTLLVQVARGQYEVRVQKSSADYSGSDTVSEQVGWSALRGRRHAPITTFNKPLTMIAMRIKATNELSGTVNSFNMIASSQIKVWNGSAWVSDQTSSNPADLFRSVLQGDANARPVADAQIDLAILQEWHGYCTAKGFTFNQVRTTVASVYDTLRDIAAAGRAAVTLRDGKWGVIWDRPDDTIVQHFSPRNSDGFQSTRAYADLPHAFRVSFINAQNNWQNDERMVYDDGYTVANATKFEGLDFVGITDPDLIWKHGRYHLAQLRLQREVYTLVADFENLVCTRGDRVRVNHDVVLWGAGAARVKSVTSAPDTVMVDDTFSMVSGKTYSMRFRLANGNSLVRTITGVSGDFKTFTLTGSGALPQAGDLALFGENGQESVILRVKSISPQADLTAKIELVDDAPAILSADTGTIPAFETGISDRIDYRAFAPRQVQIVETVQSTVPALSYFDVTWLPPENDPPKLYIVQYSVSGSGNWSVGQTVQATSIRLQGFEVGAYDFRIRAVYANEQLSGWATATASASIFAGNPDDVTGFAITVSGDSALLEWTALTSFATSHYQIRFSPLLTGATWASAAILRDNVTGRSVQVATLKGTYLIKAVSFANNLSVSPALIVSTIDPLTAYNAIELIDESTSFGGSFDRTYISSGTLRLALSGDVFAVADVFSAADYFLGTNGYEPLGYYNFASYFDLGAIYTSRLSSAVFAIGEQSSNDLFGLSDFFLPTDYFGYAATALWDVTIEVSTTNDNPAGAPTWSGWSDLIISDVSARAFRFRARLESSQFDVTPVVSGLSVSIDMPDRVTAENDLSVPTSGLSIVFSPPYRVLQGVSIAAQGLQTGDYYEITSKTKSGFSIIFKDSTGSAIARTFDYVAKGYGYEQ
jgi:hypothetical protein